METSRIQLSTRETIVMRRARAIGEASSQLLQLEENAKQICNKIRRDLGFEFVAVQMVDVIERNIQTVCGSQLDEDWYKLAKHSLEVDHKFLDIQAYIAASYNPPLIEIISGKHDRFDQFIFDKFGHKDYIRVFVPLIVRHSAEGGLIKARPEEFGFEPISDGLDRTIQLPPKFHQDQKFRSFEIIGTIEAGFNNFGKQQEHTISNDLARILFTHCCEYAMDISNSTLDHVLEVIADSARAAVSADSCFIYYPLQYSQTTRSYRKSYEVWAGPVPGKPRKNGLGARAIEAQAPQFLRASELDNSITFNPDAHAVGIRSVGAFPIFVNARQPFVRQRTSSTTSAGVMYIGLKEDRALRHEINTIRFFATLARDAIRYAMRHTQAIHSARQLANLHDMAIDLARVIKMEDLLSSVAGHTLSILMADVVIIYQYENSEKYFSSAPIVCGRYNKSLDDYTPPIELIQSRNTITACSPELVAIRFGTNDPAQKWRHWVTQEGITAGVAAPLWVGDEVVGVMFITYRRTRDFPEYEEKVIEALASTAAVAIRNRRLLESRESSVVAMTHQLRNPLSSTVTRVSGLVEYLKRVPLSPDDRNKLSQRAEQVETHLRVLDGLCQGVFVSLITREKGADSAKVGSFDREELDAQNDVLRLWDFVESTKSKDAPELDLKILDGQRKLPKIKISRWVFWNVVYCLFDNAMKYAYNNSKVEVDWMEEKGGSLLKVSSIGQRIEADERESIFRRGVSRRGDQRRNSRESVGIGLWVARVAIHSIGGDIWVELDPEKPHSSTFVVRIPT